jgi:MoaA/NifB/PqqE/SkfB family radical SAM enzyme
LPRAAHLLITWRCNLRCEVCEAWGHGASEELTAAQWAAVWPQLRSLDIVKIIGGEPFLRDDLAQLIGDIRHTIDPFIVQLVTNGTLTDTVVEFAERHAWPGLHLRVSLDGMEVTHDAARGRPGTFAQAMATLEGLSRVRRRRPFRLGVNFILTDDSRPDMDPLVARCRELGADVITGFAARPFLRHTHMATADVRAVNLGQPDEALERMTRRDHGARDGFNAVERWFLRVVNQAVFRKHARAGAELKFECRELRDLIYLMPDGAVVTCGLDHEPLGHLTREPLEALWYGHKAEQFRQRVETCPGCMQGAVEIMSRLYGG